MGKHIHWLHGYYTVVGIHIMQVAGLSGRIAGDVDDALGSGTQDGLHHIGVHAGRALQ